MHHISTDDSTHLVEEGTLTSGYENDLIYHYTTARDDQGTYHLPKKTSSHRTEMENYQDTYFLSIGEQQQLSA
jgi:hypothetical protein